jgi:hypothetical protein
VLAAGFFAAFWGWWVLLVPAPAAFLTGVVFVAVLDVVFGEVAVVAAFLDGAAFATAFLTEDAVVATFLTALLTVAFCAGAFCAVTFWAATFSAGALVEEAVLPAALVADCAAVAAPAVLLVLDRGTAVVAAAVFFAAIRSSVAHAVDADKWG